MRVILANRIGFCFGVKRAIEMAEDALREGKKAYSLGSIIHNKQVVADLSKKGLKVIKDVAGITDGAIVISSHGISPKTARYIRNKGFELIDTTCPFVLKAQKIARSLSDKGYNVIIVGERDHPEVRALIDFVAKDAFVIRDKNEAKRLKIKRLERYSVISQTTQSKSNFAEVIKEISNKRPKELKIVNTICMDVEERQNAARALARRVDTMLIVGGRNSANTKRLLEICKKILTNSHLVETDKEIRSNWFGPSSVIGITSGASTPDWMVDRVVERINSNVKCQKLKKKGVV